MLKGLNTSWINLNISSINPPLPEKNYSRIIKFEGFFQTLFSAIWLRFRNKEKKTLWNLNELIYYSLNGRWARKAVKNMWWYYESHTTCWWMFDINHSGKSISDCLGDYDLSVCWLNNKSTRTIQFGVLRLYVLHAQRHPHRLSFQALDIPRLTAKNGPMKSIIYLKTAPQINCIKIRRMAWQSFSAIYRPMWRELTRYNSTERDFSIAAQSKLDCIENRFNASNHLKICMVDWLMPYKLRPHRIHFVMLALYSTDWCEQLITIG